MLLQRIRKRPDHLRKVIQEIRLLSGGVYIPLKADISGHKIKGIYHAEGKKGYSIIIKDRSIQPCIKKKFTASEDCNNCADNNSRQEWTEVINEQLF